jgi:uncharacterized protein (DUF1501 family)
MRDQLRRQNRRDFLRSGLYGMGVSVGLPALFRHVSFVQAAEALEGKPEKHPDRILIVLELTGGNDGLNTIIPVENDAYYKARPKLGIRKSDALALNDEFSIHPACTGLQSLFRDGKLAIVHGCGYPNPNLSHFTSMEWWHTAVPHGSDPYGWLGRFADAYEPRGIENYLIDIGTEQSMAVKSAKHSPVVFKDPSRFGRVGTAAQQKVFETFGQVYPTTNSSLDFVNRINRTATVGASAIRTACAEYRTLIDYGSDNDLTLDLKKVAGMIKAGFPTRIYYLSLGGFDTHASQAPTQQLLWIYVSDAIRGFLADLQRIGRSDDVAMMVFSEFGRRFQENASAGTDHGTAAPMLIIGNRVKGGFYGRFPSLTDLDDGNLKMTTDFRSVYSTMLTEWMGFDNSQAVLKGDFPALGVFA